MMEVVAAMAWPVIDRKELEAVRGAVMVVACGQPPAPIGTEPASGALVGARPVTEAMKRVEGGLVTESVPRGEILEPTSPVVLSAEVVQLVLEGIDQDTIDLLAALLSLDVEVTRHDS